MTYSHLSYASIRSPINICGGRRFVVLLLVVLSACGVMPAKPAGPSMSDAQFFAALDLSRPELAAVRQAVIAQDWEGAKQAFAQHLRSRSSPKWFFEPGDRAKFGMSTSKPNVVEADRVVRNELPSVGLWHKFKDRIDWNANPSPNKDNDWTYELNRHIYWSDLGRAYRNTGDEKYAQAFVRQMTDWVSTESLPADSGNRPGSAWRTIEAGIRMSSSWPDSFFYFLRSPSFSNDAMFTMVKSVDEHAQHLMRHPSASGNWLVIESNGLFHAGVLFPEFRQAALWRDTALERLSRELDAQVYPDGAQIELTPGYHNVSLHNFEKAVALARLNNYPIPEGYIAKMERMYDYDLFLSQPSRYLPPLNDSGEKDIIKVLKTGYKYFPARHDYQWIISDGKEGTPPMQLSYGFPYAGYYVMRSGWDPQARYLMLDAGPFGYAHQHEDKLNIVASAYGKSHIIEGGNYAYDTSKWRTYIIDTYAHNTVLVDGLPQRRRGGVSREYVVKQPLPHAWEITPDWEYAAGIYNEGYGQRDDRRATHRRHVIFVKSGLGHASHAPSDYWIVVDVLTPRDSMPHTYDAMFHLDAEAIDIAPSTARVVTKNHQGSNFAIVPLMQQGLSVADHKGEEVPQVQGWVRKAISGRYGVRAVPTPIWHLQKSGEARFVFVLYPTPEGATMPVTAVENVQVPGGKTDAVDVVFGTAGRDRIVLSFDEFSVVNAKGANPDHRSVSINGSLH